jgi:type IV secretory pathway VirB3-like protein
MPYMGFEPTIPASKRVKTVHALDRPPTVTGIVKHKDLDFFSFIIIVIVIIFVITIPLLFLLHSFLLLLSSLFYFIVFVIL